MNVNNAGGTDYALVYIYYFFNQYFLRELLKIGKMISLKKYILSFID